MLYVRWAAFQELATTESSDPNAGLLDMPACWQAHPPGAVHAIALCSAPLNAYRAQRLYLASLQKAEQAESKSVRIDWTMDKWDSTY
jgi:hypothetical protein